MLRREIKPCPMDLAICSLQAAIAQVDGIIPVIVQVHPFNKYLAEWLLWQLGWRMTRVEVHPEFTEDEWSVIDPKASVEIHSAGG